MKLKDLLIQFLRYSIVGAVAFIVDFVTLSIVYELILEKYRYGLFVGTAAGFISGIAVNYCISKKFVFSQNESRTKNSFVDFLIYVVIGIIGLLITEGGMYLGVELMLLNYAITKVVVAGIVLIWNFLARRFLVYKKGDVE